MLYNLKVSCSFSFPNCCAVFCTWPSALTSPCAAFSTQGLLGSSCCRIMDTFFWSFQLSREVITWLKKKLARNMLFQLLLIRYKGRLPGNWGYDSSDVETPEMGNFCCVCPTSLSPPISLPAYHLYICHVPAVHKVFPCVTTRLHPPFHCFEFMLFKTHQEIFCSFLGTEQTCCTCRKVKIATALQQGCSNSLPTGLFIHMAL